MQRVLSPVLACALLLLPVRALAQAPPPPAAPQQEYVFPPGLGLLLFHVHPDRAADFEAIVARLGQVLDISPDPARRRQAATWRVFRSVEHPAESAVYLFFFDPVVAGADYDPVRMLTEAVPTEVQALYARMKAAVIRVERMALASVR
jgi:hypothetical protein